MKIGIPKECAPYEKRVSATPETVAKLVKLGCDILVEKGAGTTASFSDKAYEEAGARIVPTAKDLYEKSDLFFKVQKPTADEFKMIPKGKAVIALFNALSDEKALKDTASKGLTGVALELVPRITRAQSMDVLSSQSNLAGYKAALDGTAKLQRAVPMMMTAAGTIKPAKVLILGVGVAGLQAIATAKRLGAIVYAFDVRTAAKEQAESLGAKFIQVESSEDAETKGGYAKEMSEDYKKRQSLLIHETLKEMDVAITTALIPGKTAPRLITTAMIKDMKKGAVIVDLAAEMGGNCEGSVYGKTIEKEGVFILGEAYVSSLIAGSASELFARNLLNYFMLVFDKEKKTVHFNFDDEIVKATVVVHEGKVLREDLLKEKISSAPQQKTIPEKVATPKKAVAPKKTAPVEEASQSKTSPAKKTTENKMAKKPSSPPKKQVASKAKTTPKTTKSTKEK